MTSQNNPIATDQQANDGPEPHITSSAVATPSGTMHADSTNPYHISDWEKKYYYHGISQCPPELFYRSDLLTKPFPKPTDKEVPSAGKMIYGLRRSSPLQPVWGTVAPQICAMFRSRGIKYSSLSAVRFITEDDETSAITTGPDVIWVTIVPGSLTVEQAHDISLDILALLKDNGIEYSEESEHVVVEWMEGVVTRL